MVNRTVAALLIAGLVVVEGALMLCHTTETKSFQVDTSAFSNAVMGYAPGIHSSKAAGTTLRYLDLTWREVEPTEGEYAWSEIEEEYELESLREEGVHLVLRFICDLPEEEKHLDIPDWLYEKTGDGSWYSTSYGSGYSPNYANQEFRAAHAKVIAALGEHFGEDNFVSFVELGSLGHWGEWHIKSGEGLVPMPGERIRDEYVQPYLQAFPQAKLLMRRPFNIAAQNGLGVYNDMTGAPDDTEEWLTWLAEGGWYGQEEYALSAMPEFWLAAPVGGEFTSSISMEEMLEEELPRTLVLVDASHMTFIGPKTPSKQEYPDAYNDVLKRVGYRLRIKELQLTRGLTGATLSLTWLNEGAAPFYWDWEVNVSVEDMKGNTLEIKTLPIELSSLIPGTEQTTEVQLSTLGIHFFDKDKGPLRVTVGVIDPLTKKSAVRFAMQAERTDNGRTVLLDIS